jgi:hypothetical protein
MILKVKHYITLHYILQGQVVCKQTGNIGNAFVIRPNIS